MVRDGEIKSVKNRKKERKRYTATDRGEERARTAPPAV